MAEAKGQGWGQVGERLGVWRLEQAVAEAPSGQWWRASNATSHQAAWLLAYRHEQDAGAVLLRMAASEGQPWQHPDIAWPLDSGLTPAGRPYVVMPLLEGLPLLSQLGAVSLRRRMEWVVQLCELLLLARGQGLSMIELDPSLLWLGPQQQLRLHALAMVRTDAEAQSLGPLKGQISQAAQALQSPETPPGTPANAVGQSYSVGRLMGLLVTGRLPGAETPVGDALNPMSQWLTLRAEARTALDGLLHQSVHEDPTRRLPDLQALAEAIECWLDISGGMVSGVGALSSSASVPIPAAPPAPVPSASASLESDEMPLTVPMAPAVPTKPAPTPVPKAGRAPPLEPSEDDAPIAAPARSSAEEARRNRLLLVVLGGLAVVAAVALSYTGWLP